MLLVGSVFADDTDEQLALLNIQMNFLKATTPHFKHIAFLSKSSTGAFSGKTNVMLSNDNLESGEAHLNGLNNLLNIFRESKSEFSHFLILDSDAFPIKPGWLAQLLQKLDAPVFDSSGNFMCNLCNYEIAAALRCENLEQRLHASILFMKKEAIDSIRFSHGLVGNDLLGRQEIDIYISPYQNQKRSLAFPLMRSNVLNIHPLACGIYFDSFYHHAAGSRDITVRGDNYWDNYCPHNKDHMRCLLEDPYNFVSRLAGWNPELYAKDQLC